MLRYLENLAEKNDGDGFDKDKWEIVKVHACPKQENGYDCGVFVLTNTYLLVHCLPLRHGQC